MEKTEFSCTIRSKLNLDDVEKVINEAYHKDGPGRLPRKPLGIFKVLIVNRRALQKGYMSKLPNENY